MAAPPTTTHLLLLLLWTELVEDVTAGEQNEKMPFASQLGVDCLWKL